MERCTILILILEILLHSDVVSGTECAEAVIPKTRSFQTLSAYQGNKTPFDPRNSSMGNYVAFLFKEIDRIPRNAFLTFDSEHIINLDLTGKAIRKIDDDAFFSLLCLKSLNINRNVLDTLTWKTFNGLGNLRELILAQNKLKEISDMSFASLRRLEYLDLSRNLLRNLHPFVFSNLTALKTLDLSKNNFVYIQPEVFAPLESLKALNLGFNKFVDVNSEKWMLLNLEALDLSGNFLRQYDMSTNYTFKDLRELNLSSNQLTQLNIHALKKSFRKLVTIDLNQNFWQCDYLASIFHYLIDSRITIVPRNLTLVNEFGIDCDNNTRLSEDVFETTTIAHSTTRASKQTTRISEVKIGNHLHNLSKTNDQILLEISGVRRLLIFSLLFFVLFVIVYASVQVGMCDGFRRSCSRREGYINTTVQEDYSMLRP